MADMDSQYDVDNQEYEYEDNDNNYYNDYNNGMNELYTTETTESPYDEVNKLDLNDEKTNTLYTRRIIAGECFKLPDSAECPDDLWDAWMATFMTGLKDDEFQKSKKFRYNWTTDTEDGIVSTVKYGVAGGVVDLATLMKQGFVRRTDIKVPKTGGGTCNPTVTNWKNFCALKQFSMNKIEASEGVDAVEATADNMLEIADAVVDYITGGWYSVHLETKGLAATTYFGDYVTNTKAMRAAYDHGNKCLCTDLTESFVNGVYRTYKDVIYAVRRRYNRCRTQETMIDWFNNIDKVVGGTSPMEFKIQKLRFQMEKIFITDSSKFPKCSDFPGDELVQNHPEEYNPAINTLLTYIVFKESIPKNRWESVQRAFHQEVKGKVDYNSWHENRSELWPILDKEFKRKGSSGQNVVADSQGQPGVNQFRSRPRQQQQRGRLQQRLQQRQQQPRQQFQPNYNTRPTGRTQQPQRQQNNTGNNNRMQIRTRMLRMLCRNCSRWAGTNKYHHGPFGGTPDSNCPYDRNGQLRQGYRFIRAIDGINAIDLGIPDVDDIDTAGVEYEDINHINSGGSSIVNYT